VPPHPRGGGRPQPEEKDPTERLFIGTNKQDRQSLKQSKRKELKHVYKHKSEEQVQKTI